jgi:hypothetical protein
MKTESSDPFVQALASLCERHGGHKAVAQRIGVSAENLWQILNGIRLPSGNPRGVGPRLRAAIASTYPDWLERHPVAVGDPPGKLPISLDANPDYPAVRRVRIKALAGVNGYAVEHMDEDGPPIVFRADWFRAHGYRPDKLVALRVCGQSMEPSLYEGDLIVVNTQQTEPKDGRVFVVLYEGVVSVKRLVRDAGAWWLESDNADKRAFPRKACTDETTVPVGEVVYKQSERI